MVTGKRAQFFLLAAVIISAVVLSLGLTSNRAIVNNEPGSFYDFSYEVKREAGAVLDYEIYTEFDEDANLTNFVDSFAEDIRDRNPEANFLFIFGNDTKMELRNYGTEKAFLDVGDTDSTNSQLLEGGGTGAISTICYGNYCKPVKDVIENFNEGAGRRTLMGSDFGDDNELTVKVEGHDFTFPISKHRQVVFIMQKGVNDESFVAVK